MARDRMFQAILPLRGKILNVERSDDASLYKNNEIASLIVALGLGIKGEAVDGLRYGKVLGQPALTYDAELVLTAIIRFRCAANESAQYYSSAEL